MSISSLHTPYRYGDTPTHTQIQNQPWIETQQPLPKSKNLGTKPLIGRHGAELTGQQMFVVGVSASRLQLWHTSSLRITAKRATSASGTLHRQDTEELLSLSWIRVVRSEMEYGVLLLFTFCLSTIGFSHVPISIYRIHVNIQPEELAGTDRSGDCICKSQGSHTWDRPSPRFAKTHRPDAAISTSPLWIRGQQ